MKYTPVNEHRNGNSTICRCIPYWKRWISITTMLVYQRVIRMPQALVHSWKRMYNPLFHQNLNGTESQRTPFSKLRA